MSVFSVVWRSREFLVPEALDMVVILPSFTRGDVGERLMKCWKRFALCDDGVATCLVLTVDRRR